MSTRRDFLKPLAAVLAAPGQDTARKVRLAVVGGGFGATFHWHEHPQCVVSAVTDLYAVRRDRLRNAYRCDSVYDSLEDLLKKRRDLDAVAIFSDAPSHVKHATMCMERGLHVISAVPACSSLEEAEQLCDHIVIMDHGLVLTEGTLDRLLDEVSDVPLRPVEPRRVTLDDLFTSLTGRHLDD